MTPAILLEIDDLRVALDATPILKSVTLELRAGEILGLVGASGSGKSMTALAIMQLLPAHSSLTGTVRLRGEALTGKTDQQMQKIRGRDIGMVFQEPMTALNPLMCVGDQVAETVRLHRPVSTVEARRAARAALDLVGLPEEQVALDRFPHELSGGQRQRVAIAMAVAMAPPLLIADEPTTSLDVIAQAQVLRLLRELVRTRDMGLILVTHDLAIIAQLADRVAVMQAGEIVEHGATADFLQRAHHPYAAALLAAAAPAPKRGARSAKSADLVPILEVSGIVREYPRKRRSLWHAATPFAAPWMAFHCPFNCR